MKKVKLLITLIFAVLPLMMHAGDFTVGNKTFLLNGEPFVVKAAEVHYPRIPQAYWDHRIKMCKALGMNTLCIYVFWNIHEQRVVLVLDGTASMTAKLLVWEWEDL